MNILVINAGSSSLKYQLMDPYTNEVFAKGNAERIGEQGSFIGHSEQDGDKQTLTVALPDHKTALGHIQKIIDSLGLKIDGIGHRMVQGGWYFDASALVDEQTLERAEEVAPLAPLHNYPEIEVAKLCSELYPGLVNVFAFDTAFHHNMPERAWRYPLPREVADDLHIRKYGAHGTSHRCIWQKVAEFSGGKTHKLISCHLGSGSSLCAIENGRSVETTMGLTPLDGLIMGTRTGTIDPATVLYLMREGGYSLDEVDTMLNKKSGVLALSEVSNDFRDIEQAAQEGNDKAALALEMFGYRTAQLILYVAEAMEGFDTIAFSAGVGENAPSTRADVIRRLSWLGVKIDDEKNRVRSDEVRDITGEGSSARVLVVPTNEELMIALDTAEFVAQSEKR